MLPLDRLPDPPAGPKLQLLEGVSILDLTTSIAGPYAAMLLGDMGADVVKIERPEAEMTAGHGDPRLWTVNRSGS